MRRRGPVLLRRRVRILSLQCTYGHPLFAYAYLSPSGEPDPDRQARFRDCVAMIGSCDLDIAWRASAGCVTLRCRCKALPRCIVDESTSFASVEAAQPYLRSIERQQTPDRRELYPVEVQP